MGELDGVLETSPSVPLALAAEKPISAEEHRYITAARAPNTLRGYRSDWAEFMSWCASIGVDPLPAAASTISGYLTMLAGAGSKVGTMSRRLSAIKFAHRTADLSDPTDNARVITVWEGIRRTHSTRPDQAAPLMPPDYGTWWTRPIVTKTWKSPGRDAQPDIAGARDRALLLVGFVAALRRSEICALDVGDVRDHANGLVLSLPRSKTNQLGSHDELVSANPRRCPVTVLHYWLDLAHIDDGPLFQG